MNNHQFILVINTGSSSIKMAVYEIGEVPKLKLSGRIEHIGSEGNSLVIKEGSMEVKNSINANDFHSSAKSLIGWLEKQQWFGSVKVIGHRIVHGMNHTKAEIITEELMNELASFIDYAPDHLPSEIDIVRMFRTHYRHLLQVACFDTAFHTSIPDVAKIFAIPRKYYEQGIHRYGFHGISFSYLLKELESINALKSKGRVIIAHLGNGASIAAIKDGKCIDTSMGFTPTGGIVMGTRSGDLDPGIAWFLMKEHMSAKSFSHLINKESGLLGISGLSSNMQVLLEHEKKNEYAALAIDVFCYQVKKYIAAYMAVLEGLDVLIFSGGIGENAVEIRRQICSGLQYAGIILDEERNKANGVQITSNESNIEVYVIPTNEELMIAKTVLHQYNK